MNDDLAGTGLTKELSGVPVMQLEIRNAVERDGIIYNVAGILAGCLIAIVFFRKVSFMVDRGVPAAACHPVGIGRAGLGRFQPQHVPQRDDAADHGHQFFRFDAVDVRGARPADRRRGQVLRFRNAVLVVGPACVLTHATAGISFLALQFSEFGFDPQLRRGRPDGDDHRALRGAAAGAGVRRSACS